MVSHIDVSVLLLSKQCVDSFYIIFYVLSHEEVHIDFPDPSFYY